MGKVRGARAASDTTAETEAAAVAGDVDADEEIEEEVDGGGGNCQQKASAETS